MAQKPNHDLAKPFEAADINKIAESLLKRDRFDNDRLPSDLEDSDDSSSSSEESEDSDLESAS